MQAASTTAKASGAHPGDMGAIPAVCVCDPLSDTGETGRDKEKLSRYIGTPV